MAQMGPANQKFTLNHLVVASFFSEGGERGDMFQNPNNSLCGPKS